MNCDCQKLSHWQKFALNRIVQQIAAEISSYLISLTLGERNLQHRNSYFWHMQSQVPAPEQIVKLLGEVE